MAGSKDKDEDLRGHVNRLYWKCFFLGMTYSSAAAESRAKAAIATKAKFVHFIVDSAIDQVE